LSQLLTHQAIELEKTSENKLLDFA